MDNIYKKLRLECTEETVMRGAGKTIAVKKFYSQTKLARELHISQPTLELAEKGITPSLSTIQAYHDYFHIPYSTLLGETNMMEIDNFHINKELGLSDKCISTIKGLSPIALSMLNVFIGKEENTEIFLYKLAELLYSMTEQLKQNGFNKNEHGYLELKERTEKSFVEYMKTVSFKDIETILFQLEKQEELIFEINNTHQ